MGESFVSSDSRTKSKASNLYNSKKMSKLSLVASGPKSFSHVNKQMPSFNNGKIIRGSANHLACFLLKVGVLETIRRFSKARCPFVWSGLQALQVFCYPPFKWLQRWAPIRNLAKGMQVLSRPLLVLSIASAFSDQSSEYCDVNRDATEDSRSFNDSHAVPESQPEVPLMQSVPDVRIGDEVQPCQSVTNWLLDLKKALENENITLPDRINDEELQRFHTAANGDFSCLLLLVKKAIRWRETYKIISGHELEMWSNMVFWHGVDVKNRPCLIIRLGLAFISLRPSDRPRLIQAVVSQVEYGILHLVDNEDPQITVLVDCEGLSLRFPMQMVRSCSTILQENYPGRLGCLFVLRLPPVVRVLAQTFIQVLKPPTRQKLRVIGRMYKKILSEHLHTIPSFLGGTCECTVCAKLSNSVMLHHANVDVDHKDENGDINSAADQQLYYPDYEPDENVSCDQSLRSAIIGVLIVWILIALIAGIYDSESQFSLS